MRAKRFLLVSIILIVFSVLFTKRLVGQEVSFSVSNQPLSEVLEMLSRNYNVKIAFDGDLTSKVLVSGNFKSTQILTAISSMLQGTSLEVVSINYVIVIKPKKYVQEAPHEDLPPKPPKVELKIFGWVRDKETNESLPYATVSLLGTNIGVSANSDGFFTLFINEIDTISIRASYLGYNPTEMSIVPTKQKGNLNIFLSSQQTQVAETIITKRQPDIVATEPVPGMLRWNSNRNTDIPSLNGLDIAAPLQLLPGIDGTTESLSGLVIRNLPSDKNLFVFDGFTIYHIDHFFGAFTSFNSKAVKDIRVFKSGFDSRWGGRASSVIEITGKSGNANAISVDAGVDLLTTDLLVEGPIGNKLTFLIAGRRSITDFYRSDIYYQLLESARADIAQTSRTYPSAFRVDPNEPTLYYSDFNAKLSFKPSSKDLLSLSVFMGSDKMNLKRETLVQKLLEDSDWGNIGSGFRWARQWNDKLNQVLTIGVSQYHLGFVHIDTTQRKRQGTNVIDKIIRDMSTSNRLNDININLFQNFKINASNALEFGLQSNAVKVDFSESYIHTVNTITVIDTTRTRNTGMFLATLWGQHVVSANRIKSLSYGFRASYYNPTSRLYFEPRAQLSVRLSPKSFLKFSAGRYNQFVNQILTVSNSSFRRIWTVANGESLPVVSSNHFTGGAIFRFPFNITLDFEAYHRFTKGITSQQAVLRRSGTDNTVREQLIYINTNNRTSGLDVMLHKEHNNFQYWLSYTLAKSNNVSDNINWGEPYPAITHQLHELKMAAMGRWKGWGLSVSTILGSGKPWDEPIYLSNLKLSSEYQKNSNRLSPYTRVDFGISYLYKIKGVDFKGGLNLFNLFNWDNTLARPYMLSETPYQTFIQTGTPLVYSDIMGMGFAHTLYLNVKF
jgi:hypothetical protein